MASFTLQPGLRNLDTGILQKGCDSSFTPHPEYASRPNGSCRSQQMFTEYCHSPYMAGKGVPSNLILVDDALRPQSTKRFGKVTVKPIERNLFPLQNNLCLGTPQVSMHNPSSTRAQLQNELFQKRYPSTQCAFRSFQ
jgi:hypothetical protein